MTTFINYFLCARHCAGFLMWINSFSPHHNPVGSSATEETYSPGAVPGGSGEHVGYCESFVLIGPGGLHDSVESVTRRLGERGPVGREASLGPKGSG